MPDASFCHNCGAAVLTAAMQVSSGVAPWTLADIGKAIGLVIVGLIAISVPIFLLADALADGGKIEEDPAALTVGIAATVFVELLLLGTAVHFSVRKYGLSFRSLGLRRPSRGGFWLTLGLAIVLVIAGLAINFIYFTVLEAVDIEPETDIEEAYKSAGPLITLAVASLLFAPLMEEVFFRGFVFGGLRGRWGTGWAVLASGVLFGLVHIGNPGTIYVIPPIALIGGIFALGYAYSGSILTTVLAHLIFNSLALAAGIAEHA